MQEVPERRVQAVTYCCLLSPLPAFQKSTVSQDLSKLKAVAASAVLIYEPHWQVHWQMLSPKLKLLLGERPLCTF